jgi:hypothetical protein
MQQAVDAQHVHCAGHGLKLLGDFLQFDFDL